MPFHQRTVKLVKAQLFYTLKRDLFTQSPAARVTTATPVEVFTDGWAAAKPFASIPGPSKLELLRGFLPGGRFYDKSLVLLFKQFRADFGDIFLTPGLFGKRSVLFTFNPADYQRVFRTEGTQPIRRGLDIVEYYRKVHRPEVFKHAAGLVTEQGEGWAHFRSAVNPVMMNLKNVKLYAPKVNKVVDEFMALIRRKRDVYTLEMPANFECDINNWAMESVCLVALDTELGMINNSANNPKAKVVIDGMREFFELLFELDLQPSLWKYVATPKFKRIMRTLDEMTELTTYYIDQAIERVQREAASKAGAEKPEAEKSVLQRLLGIDRTVAVVMAMDMLLAGVDTTTSAFTACLLCLAKSPCKQARLREELRNILPAKCSAITSDSLKNLPYLRACIKEALRMYPVSPANFRTTGQDVVLSGYRVPKGVDIAMPGQLLHHDATYYADPLEYQPERWLRGAEAVDANGCPLNRNVPFVFLPFGFGPRICIGKRFVDLELEVALAKLVRNFEIAYDYPVENMFKTNIINVPAKPLRFKFTEVTM